MTHNIILINTTDSFHGFLDKVSHHNLIYLDTEFIREKTYRPILALLQVSFDATTAYLVDPCCDAFNIADFFNILKQDQSKKIILHSARQDLEIFYTEFDYLPQNLVDTQIVAAALGYGDQIGFEGLVKIITADLLDKTQQRTNWLERPLSEKQLSYAAFDVLYLAKIFPVLEGALKTQNREAWIADELKSLQDTTIYTISPLAVFKKIRHKLLHKKAIKILYGLTQLREQIAQQQNLIRSIIASDETLIKIAQKAPCVEQDLLKIKGTKDNFIKKNTNEILDVIIHALNIEIPETHKPERQTPEQDRLAQIISMAADAIATSEMVARRLFAPHQEIAKFVSQGEAIFMSGWRYDLFGHIVHKIINAQTGIYYKDGNIILN